MNIHWNPTIRKGLYNSPNRGIKSYRTGKGWHKGADGKLVAGYSKNANKYKK